MIEPINIPILQKKIIETAVSKGWLLIGYVFKDDFSQGEAIINRRKIFLRISPNGKVKADMKFNWRKDQDRTIIYPEASGWKINRSPAEQNYYNVQHARLRKKLSKLFRQRSKISD